tara:strand:- start:3864 stop:4577 length:714 start_codon:yes stop_codon:yes gene_type:complete
MDEFEKKINDDDISETSSVSENEDSDNEDMISSTNKSIKVYDDEEQDGDEEKVPDRDEDEDEEKVPDSDEDDDEVEDEDEDEELNKIMIKETFNNEIDNEIDMLENDEDLDEEYFQKIDTRFRDNIIKDYHPELKVHNFEEIQALCKVVRDEKGKIVDPLHKTLPFITCYEKTRIIGERAKQINKGAKHFVNIDPEITDGYLIALKEYEEKKIPFIIQRPLPNGHSEYWRFCDLECF